MTLQPWKTLESKYVIQDRWMTMRADRCQTSQGVIVDPYFVQESEDWAQILAFDEQFRVLLTWQYRHGDGKTYCEIPCGMIDPEETAVEAAKRELLEETGCEAESFTALPMFSPNSARINNRVHSFIARGARRTSETSFDDSEEIESKFVTLDQLMGWVASGEFAQGLHIATLLLAFQHLNWLAVNPE